MDADEVLIRSEIRLKYEVIEPSRTHTSNLTHDDDPNVFAASYAAGAISLTNGEPLFLDPKELRGQRIGTYLMNEVVTWAHQWPHARVRRIRLLPGQADNDNKERRNRFYERFGIVFDYDDDSTRQTGLSRAMQAKDLSTVEPLEKNVLKHTLADFVGGLMLERNLLRQKLTKLEANQNRLSAQLKEARDYPVRWAALRVWWQSAHWLIPMGIVAALATVLAIGAAIA